MKKLRTLHDLLRAQLRGLYDVEQHQIPALAIMKKQSESEALQAAIANHMQQTKEHVKRLEEVFELLSETPKANNNLAIQGLVNDCLGLLKQCAEPFVRDAALVTSLQRIEHFEIAAYGAACACANDLENYNLARLLHLTLDDEKRMDRRLSEIAEHGVNERAIFATAK